MTKITRVALCLLLCAPLANAAIKTELIDYKVDKARLQGALVYDDAYKGPRPAVLVFHEWLGRGPYVQMRAEQLAALGYVAFTADLYGKGITAKDHNEAKKLVGLYGDRKLMRNRASAALELVKKRPEVDPAQVAAIGYCFGGTAALELARSGADFGGAVVFHGSLDTQKPENTKPIKAKILALIGADDAFVTPGIPAFEKEMNSAQADWQLVLYSHTVHSFTKPDSGSDASTGMAYNVSSDRRSWQAMLNFFAEIFEPHSYPMQTGGDYSQLSCNYLQLENRVACHKGENELLARKNVYVICQAVTPGKGFIGTYVNPAYKKEQVKPGGQQQFCTVFESSPAP